MSRKTPPAGVGIYSRKNARKFRAELRKETRKVAKEHRETSSGEENFPMPAFRAGGKRRPQNLVGPTALKPKSFSSTSHTFSTAFPWVAGPSLGNRGPYIGPDLVGGGDFCFDPWELYAGQVISGMSMIISGKVGTGKSTLAKAVAARLVQHGRKLSVATDSKGEWSRVVEWLGGDIISIGPGQPDRINPLDPGVRPSVASDGTPMTDAQWVSMVRSRRMTLLGTLAHILMTRELRPAEHTALARALDAAVATAKGVVILPDVIASLSTEKRGIGDELIKANESLSYALGRCTEGDLAGFFDGETTAHVDPTLPAISLDTSALKGASAEAKRIANACAGSWMESMVTNPDGGQRICIYEEGWDNIGNEADLKRMVSAWKLAREYGIFNVLLLHKFEDLDMAGNVGSKALAMAKSLIADADIKVIHRQDHSVLQATKEQLDLTDKETRWVRSMEKGEALWKINDKVFVVECRRTTAERPVFDTDGRMEILNALKEEDSVA